MTPTPLLTGQDIGQAEKATRAVLDRLLAQTGTTFHGWVILNLLATHGSALGHDELASRVTHGLKIDEATVDAAVTDLVEHGLLRRTPSAAAGPDITLTPSGTARFHQLRDGIAQITERLYGGLPADDLAVAHRVLAAVTERANAALAS